MDSERPASFFKYFGHSGDPRENGGLKVLENLALKVTPPVEFNDPFEFTPVVSGLPPEIVAQRELKSMLTDRSFFDQHRAQLSAFRRFSDFQAAVRANLAEITVVTSKSVEGSNHSFQQAILSELSKMHGVVCFSATAVQPLMWAHYGAAHTGLVLEFDGSCPLFAGSGFLQVEYAKQRAVYDAEVDDRKQLETLARRKSMDWSYEQEYRLIVALSHTTQVQMNGRNLHLIPIDAAWIKSVTVGLRAELELKSEVMRLRRRPDLAHVSLHRISMSQRSYLFDRTEVPHF